MAANYWSLNSDTGGMSFDASAVPTMSGLQVVGQGSAPDTVMFKDPATGQTYLGALQQANPDAGGPGYGGLTGTGTGPADWQTQLQQATVQRGVNGGLVGNLVGSYADPNGSNYWLMDTASGNIPQYSTWASPQDNSSLLGSALAGVGSFAAQVLAMYGGIGALGTYFGPALAQAAGAPIAEAAIGGTLAPVSEAVVNPVVDGALQGTSGAGAVTGSAGAGVDAGVFTPAQIDAANAAYQLGGGNSGAMAATGAAGAGVDAGVFTPSQISAANTAYQLAGGNAGAMTATGPAVLPGFDINNPATWGGPAGNAADAAAAGTGMTAGATAAGASTLGSLASGVSSGLSAADIAKLAVGTGSALLGAGITGNAATTAAQTQAQAGQDALALQKSIYDQNVARVQPWTLAGGQALQQEVAGLQPGGQFNKPYTLADFQSGPQAGLYDFAKGEAMGAMGNRAAAGGAAQNTGTTIGAGQLAGDLANQYYNQGFTQNQTTNNTTLAALQGLSGQGQSAAGTQSNAGTNLASTGTGTIQGIGNVNAAGTIANNQALSNAVTNIGNAVSSNPNAMTTLGNGVSNLATTAGNGISSSMQSLATLFA